jgi:hypothetical protein
LCRGYALLSFDPPLGTGSGFNNSGEFTGEEGSVAFPGAIFLLISALE